MEVFNTASPFHSQLGISVDDGLEKRDVVLRTNRREGKQQEQAESAMLETLNDMRKREGGDFKRY